MIFLIVLGICILWWIGGSILAQMILSDGARVDDLTGKPVPSPSLSVHIIVAILIGPIWWIILLLIFLTRVKYDIDTDEFDRFE